MYGLKTRAKFFENGAPVLIFSTISTKNQDFQGKKEYTYKIIEGGREENRGEHKGTPPNK